MTFTCAIGKFVFDERVTLGMAKLIRDTVMGVFRNPATGGERLRTSQDCLSFAQKEFKEGHYLISVHLN